MVNIEKRIVWNLEECLIYDDEYEYLMNFMVLNVVEYIVIILIVMYW